LEKKVYFGKDLILERRPNFGMRAIDGKKESCRKKRKNNMQEEKKHDVEADRPDHARVRVFDKYCNDYKPKK
jgi:hypothetical protein